MAQTTTKMYRLRWRVACACEYLHAACRSRRWRIAHNYNNMTWAGKAGRLQMVRHAVDSLRTERW